MDKVKEYIEKNKNKFLEELFELLRIASISAKSEHKKDIITCAELLKSHLEKQGFNNCEICKKKIVEPLYWADPKFYNIPQKIFFCGADCSLIYYKKIKKLFKIQ